MIKQGAKIFNARTGQIMIFRKTGAETNGMLLEIESFNPKSDALEPVHIHPKQESSCEVISGQLHFLVNGSERIVGPGEHIVIPAGVPHCFWNEDLAEARSIQRFSPALNIAGFFDTLFALSRDGKLNKKGRPNLFQGSLILLKHKDEIQVTNPPWWLQLVTYRALAPIGHLIGYRSHYQSKNETAGSVPVSI